eukprot:TRINITY_DN19410_c0_g1_i1.p1 TRINITY_DN19410_c0_g1~~TRINITY_DN19410_c0_g1_i1.p1  ORF type:complete len:574 (-),score=84.93 TRINITY_DN19410_c0_g1_i1:4-1725(-)
MNGRFLWHLIAIATGAFVLEMFRATRSLALEETEATLSLRSPPSGKITARAEDRDPTADTAQNGCPKQLVLTNESACRCLHRRTPAEMRAHREALLERAVPCVDDIAKKRMGIPMMSNVLSRCALLWIGQHAEAQLHPKMPQLLFDYAYDAMDYPFAAAPFRNWLLLSAFLPQDSIALPFKKGSGRNHILLGTPIIHRLESLFATSLWFDVQLALRLDEVATYATPILLQNLIAKILAMGRVTFLVMPCSGNPEMTDVDLIYQAANSVRAKGPLGIHHLEVEVESVAVFKYQTCVKELLRITTRRVERSGRAKWCYYPSEHFARFNISGRRGIKVTDLATGKQVTTWHPSRLPYIDLANLFGWSVVRDTRERILADVLRQPPCPHIQLHNLVLLGSGRYDCRPTPLNLRHSSESFVNPTGLHYVAFMQMSTCTGDGLKWKEVYDDRRLVHLTVTRDMRYADGYFWRRDGGSGWRHANTLGVQSSLFVDGRNTPICTVCTECMMQFRSPEQSPAVCGNCSDCLDIAKNGMYLAKSFVGCNDVEAVNENGSPRPELCWDTQLGPIARPSAPAGLL